jgi:hypothetical protein
VKPLRVAVPPVELPPGHHVGAVVEVDRAPFVGDGAGVAAGSAAAGGQREPLPVEPEPDTSPDSVPQRREPLICIPVWK